MRDLLFIAILFCSFQLVGQPSEAYSLQDNRVIAVPGLNMRSEPSLAGEKITFIPFGKEVRILEPHQTFPDTVGTIKNYYRDIMKTINPEQVIDGLWVKARYRGKVGYVFSAYLIDYRRSNEYVRGIEEKGINKDFVVMFEGLNCMDNFHYKKDWHYYAAQGVEDGICLVEIKPSFTKTFKQGYADLRTHSSADFSPPFIIGSREPLPQNEIQGNINKPIYYTNDFEDVKMGEEMPNELSIKILGKRITPELILTKNGKTQVLNPYVNKEQTTKNRPLALNFRGDLDGDGSLDYLIQYGEKFSQTVLYLSSLAGPNQIVKPVAVWYSGYCC